VLVCLFNASRGLYWLAKSIITPSQSSLDRRDHFMKLVVNSASVWPRQRTYRFKND
jgi:hypothetical protein